MVIASEQVACQTLCDPSLPPQVAELLLKKLDRIRAISGKCGKAVGLLKPKIVAQGSARDDSGANASPTQPKFILSPPPQRHDPYVAISPS
jgi:hypothetical protein